MKDQNFLLYSDAQVDWKRLREVLYLPSIDRYDFLNDTTDKSKYFTFLVNSDALGDNF